MNGAAWNTLRIRPQNKACLIHFFFNEFKMVKVVRKLPFKCVVIGVLYVFFTVTYTIHRIKMNDLKFALRHDIVDSAP